MRNLIRFGIPSLDELMGIRQRGHEQGAPASSRNPGDFGVHISKGSAASFCILGPDGTGKSLLAMHLASRYVADSYVDGDPSVRVLYISTDLRSKMAQDIWECFYLDFPTARTVPFEEKVDSYKTGPKVLLLKPIDCGNLTEMAQYLEHPTAKDEPTVAFVDLASQTAGDDWGFINRILALLRNPGKDKPRHLIVIDAVEGLETLVGERDAFGERSSRRARIAQVIRLASDKCHVVFVVEEPKIGERLPEEFVADVVIRLRRNVMRDYARRTVEIEKVRDQAHVSGQHPFVIRKGGGSTTGESENRDDPCLEGKAVKDLSIHANANRQRTQSYIHVFHSLHLYSRQVMEEQAGGAKSPPDQIAAFGVQFLDDMLERRPAGSSPGLQCSTVTPLIGDPLTQKTRLGLAWLCQSLNMRARDFWKAVHKELAKQERPRLSRSFIKMVSMRLVREEKREEKANKSQRAKGVAIYLTTHDIHATRLSEVFALWLGRAGLELLVKDELKFLANDRGKWEQICKESLAPYLLRRVICRRLEIHDQSSPILMHIVRQAVREAQKWVLPEGVPQTNSSARFESSWPIRLVIDDLSNLLNAYPAVKEDSLFLPSLLFYLGREGISSLIVETQPGRPGYSELMLPTPGSELRKLVQKCIHTWWVPFYGENRIAITAIPPLTTDEPTVIRELRQGKLEEFPQVDPHFELYSGLEQHNPQPVPLEVRLFAESKASAKYFQQENKLLLELFTPVTQPSLRGFPPSAPFLPRRRKNDAVPPDHGESHLPAGSVTANSINNYARLVVHQESPSEQIIKALPELTEVELRDETAEERGALAYDQLRDFSYTQRDTRLDHTLVFQIDEFWAIPDYEPIELRSQWSYLSAQTVKKDGSRDRMIDPFGLFQPVRHGETVSEGRRRIDFYTPREYKALAKMLRMAPSKEPDDAPYVDRVPYTWDFGFLLCRKRSWLEAMSDDRKGNEFVKDVWDRLPEAGAEVVRQPEKLPSWRQFLRACKLVADSDSKATGSTQKSPAFDLSLTTPETFSCWFLEVWLSEIYDNNPEFRGSRFRKPVMSSWKPPQNYGLIQMIESSTVSLFKTWLLILEVLDLSQLGEAPQGFQFRTRKPDPSAVAVRHWYKTACDQASESKEVLVAKRLPGHYTVRGDWFLAVARGSRSSRLGDRALDILSSRRANFSRLQLGVGLPTRDLIKEKGYDRLRTNLALRDERGNSISLPYRSLIHLGEICDSPGAKREPRTRDEFYWLWRSNLGYYVRHARIWQKWLHRMVFELSTLRSSGNRNWLGRYRDGFELYDAVDLRVKIYNKKWQRKRNSRQGSLAYVDPDSIIPRLAGTLDIWTKFMEMRGFLLAELQQATPPKSERP